MITYIVQFIVAIIATLAFSIVFSAPRSELLFCGISGGIGWIFYVIILATGGGITLANVVGTLMLTLFSRCLATIRKNPATVYLIAGIFPLVPGAGIYYTAYYLIMDDMANFSYYGLWTLKTAGAIVMGIIFGMAMPQSWISKVFGPSGRK